MRQYLPDFFISILAARKKRLRNSEEEARFIQFTVISLVGVTALFSFSIYNFFVGQYPLSGILMVCAAFLAKAWGLLYRGVAEHRIYQGSMLMFCLLLLYLLFLGGEDNSLVLWINISPLVMFFLLGRKEGLRWTLCLLIFLALYFFCSPFLTIGHHYSHYFSIRFLVTYMVISVITFSYENLRYIYGTGMTEKHILLMAEIAERKKIEVSLRESEQRYHAIYLQAVEGIVLTDFTGTIVECNPQFLKMLGYQEGDVVGKKVFSFLDHSEEGISQLEKMKKGEAVLVENKMRTSAGVYIHCEQSGKRINGELIIMLYRNVTERKLAELALEQANEALKRLAHIDGLTQIANRRKFEQSLAFEWNRMKREGKFLGVLMGDIDNFKQYNDLYGHQMGDDCLKKVAFALSSAVKRPADLVARYGGEEFVVLLPDTDYQGAFQIAEIMRQKVEAMQLPHSGSTTGKVVTVSFGVAAVKPQGNLAKEEFVAAADQALYRAKGSGRNRVC